MYAATGILKESFEDGLYRLALEVDSAIVDLARALVPKYIRLNKQKYSPHISVVREMLPLRPTVSFHNQKIDFTFDFNIYAGNTYYWLCAESEELKSIRVKLGLPAMDWYTRPPDNKDCFHITIGNLKGI